MEFQILGVFFIIFIGLTLCFKEIGGFSNPIATNLYYMILLVIAMIIFIVKKIKKIRERFLRQDLAKDKIISINSSKSTQDCPTPDFLESFKFD